MSHPTPPAGHGDHTQCQPAQCLVARYAQERARLRAPADPPPATGDVCATCDGPIEYLARPDDRQRYGALAGRGGWRHLTAEPGQVHAAYPTTTTGGTA